MTDEPIHPDTCEACRTIDGADGVEDGKLYRSFAPDPRAEHRFVRGVEHAQHRVADAISGFAGSIPFIYIHVGSPVGAAGRIRLPQ